MAHLHHSIALTAAALLTGMALSASSVADSLTEQLTQTDTRTDSIALLYNIYDCTPYPRQGKVLEQLYAVAEREGDPHTISDIIKLEANYFTADDSMQRVLIARAEQMPDGDLKAETLLFTKIRYTARLVRLLPEDSREAKLRQYLAQYVQSSSLDTYRRIEYLFYLCIYLRSSTDGELLAKYMLELQQLIDNLPARDIALKSLFYTQAAISYMTNDMYDEAIAANRTLLEIIDELKRQYRAKGRIYRNYDRTTYLCYRRLLRCHAALSPEDVDNYYAILLSLKDSDESLRRDFDFKKRPTIYYLMAKKRYAEAIPLIKEQLDDAANTNSERFYLAESLMEAADAVNDKETLLSALRIHDTMLRDRIIAKAAERYKELQIIYEVNDLRQQNDSLVLANRQKMEVRHRDRMIWACIGLGVLMILVIVMMVLHQRSRRLARRLTEANKLLLTERDALQRTKDELIEARDKANISERFKSDFVNNMSREIRTPLAAVVEYSNLIADCIDDTNYPYARRFADLVSLNTDLLLTLVNDVLDLPAIENSKLSINLVSASAQEICHVALDSVRKHIAPGVGLVFTNQGEDDVKIYTDPQRVEQVLIHLLSNASKFTADGTITFGYKLSPDRKSMTFTVTDTGIGIPKEKEEAIFSRFEKVDPSTQGNGLGLYISRLLASLLKGELLLDTAYRHGARFTFTIPVV